MQRGLIPFSVLIRRYVCAQCQGNLAVRWSEEEGNRIECARNPEHFGVWRKSYRDWRRARAKVEGIALAFDKELQALFDWWPRPRVTAKQAYQDLYPEGGTL